MTLFGGTVDKTVQSPLMKEYNEIKARLERAVKTAEKSGDREAVRIARLDLYEHLKLADSYHANAAKQLSIFDV